MAPRAWNGRLFLLSWFAFLGVTVDTWGCLHFRLPSCTANFCLLWLMCLGYLFCPAVLHRTTKKCDFCIDSVVIILVMMMMLANNYTMLQDVVRGTSCQDFVQQAYIHIDYIALTVSHKRGNNPNEPITQDMEKNTEQNIILFLLFSASCYKKSILLYVR